MASARAADVWPAVCHHLQGFFAALQMGDLVLRDNSLLMLSGGPAADFNMAVVDAGDAEEAVLREFAARVRAGGVQALFMLPSAPSGRLVQVAREEGLAEAGSAPLMLLDKPSAAPERTTFSVERVQDKASLGVVADLIASAFSLDREWVGRTFAAPALLGRSGVEYWLASREAEPYSTVTCLSSSGLVGIWNMATSPEHQRQGAGRAVLEAAMRHHTLSGARRFYLIATPAGQPLYDAIGFRTIDELSVYVAGQSAQFGDR